MKLALHRSIVFWSGLLVMAFVCWAWRDSHERWAGLSKRSFNIRNLESGVLAVRHIPNPRWSKVDDPLHYEPLPAARKWRSSFFPAPAFVLGKNPDWQRGGPSGNGNESYNSYHRRSAESFKIGSWSLFIPHWLILLTVSALWLGLIFWRARRRTAATKP